MNPLTILCSIAASLFMHGVGVWVDFIIGLVCHQSSSLAIFLELESLVHRAWRMVEEIHGAHSTSTQPSAVRGRMVRWETPSPPAGTFKFNSDATIFNDGTVGYGFVVRDDGGEVLIAGAKRETAGGSSTLVEARALLHGLDTSAACGQRVFHVE
ncbi:hypothetical protein ACS0TY_002234 [Phlomoides rotata]